GIEKSDSRLKFFEIRRVFNAIPASLRRLLIGDILARIAEGLVEVLVIIYLTSRLGVTARFYGILVAIEMVTATLVYLPSASMAARWGRKPFVVLTFCFFAFFPLAVMRARNSWQLAAAFVIAGLREIGEPSRKSMITGFSPQPLRARVVGLYYLIRQLTIAPS